jgi:hypothetical protein
MSKNVNLDALKNHLFETLEGIKNLSDEKASPCEKVSIEQAKSIIGVADSIIDIYKVQLDAMELARKMDDVAGIGDILTGLGITEDNEIKQICG